MKQHLQTKHGILSPDDLQLNSNEEIQIHIDKMIRKVTPYCVPKQVELKQVTAEWLVTDSLPFNVVHRKGYKKMIQRFDPAFILPNNKGIKKDLTIAYQKSILALKNGIQYTTLLVINSSIEALKFEFADSSTLTLEELNKIINENKININE
ncbi:17696_t:CDS:2, partial [Funneliformis geosporum]